MHTKISLHQIWLAIALLGLVSLWILCLYLLMEVTRQLLDVLHYVVELAQLS